MTAANRPSLGIRTISPKPGWSAAESGAVSQARLVDGLSDAAHAHGGVLHAYVLMTNPIHWLTTPSEATSIGKTLQALGRCFVFIAHFISGNSRRHPGTLIISPPAPGPRDTAPEIVKVFATAPCSRDPVGRVRRAWHDAC